MDATSFWLLIIFIGYAAYNIGHKFADEIDKHTIDLGDLEKRVSEIEDKLGINERGDRSDY